MSDAPTSDAPDTGRASNLAADTGRASSLAPDAGRARSTPDPAPARISFLGPEGTFTEQALLSLQAAAGATRVPCPSVPAALTVLRTGEVDAAVVPIENSVEGSVPATMDELVHGEPLLITAEVMLEVSFELFVRPGIALGDIATVASHPHALAQCRGYLESELAQARSQAVLSTADAAVAVAEGRFDAAVCAAIAGQRSGLTSLARRIEDNSGAVTRFALVSRPGPPPPRTGNDLTTLVAHIAHDRAGALLEILTELATRGVNMVRLESRPTRQRIGRYYFVLDCAGHITDHALGEAMRGMRRLCPELRFLGSYPRAISEGPVSARAPRADAEFDAAARWFASLLEGRQ